jgi:hypothetical protein
MDERCRRAHPSQMSIAPLPVTGVVVGDQRQGGRALRVSWHAELGVFVVSIWRDGACVGTVQLPPEDAARVAGTLVDGLAEGTRGSARGRQLA